MGRDVAWPFDVIAPIRAASRLWSCQREPAWAFFHRFTSQYPPPPHAEGGNKERGGPNIALARFGWVCWRRDDNSARLRVSAEARVQGNQFEGKLQSREHTDYGHYKSTRPRALVAEGKKTFVAAVTLGPDAAPSIPGGYIVDSQREEAE